ncbi:MAG TPA: hydrogen gas-evolving membrane-bound hydrogenase subunit E, partial [Citricoccus sp.]
AAMTKSAQFPFHSWLPDAMAAATPVSAYLHAAAVVKAGIFLLLRFSPVFHDDVLWSVLLVVVGLVTSAVGGWRALQQQDLKKLMAYSTVSQLGLIVAAIGTGTEAGIVAAFIHTIAHALFKSGLFMVVGVVDHATGTRDLRRLPVLYRALPFTFAVTVLGAGAMAGIPPLLGFISKESIFTALNHWAVDGGAAGTLAAWAGPVALVGAALGSVLTFAYCAKIVVGGFWDPERPGRPERAANPAPAAPVHGAAEEEIHAPGGVLVTAAALPILASVAALFVLPLLDAAVGSATGAAYPGPAAEPHFVLWHGLTPELLTTLAVFAVGLVTVLLRHRLWPALEERTLPFGGASVIEACTRGLTVAGRGFARITARDAAASHAATMVTSAAAVMVLGTLVLNAQGLLPPLQEGLNQPVDGVLLVLITAATLGVVLTRSRLGATVGLSAIGILMTVQILSLGAPDVALTQLLVESLTIIVIMLVLQKLPRTFRAPRMRRALPAAVIAVVAGLATGLATWGLTSRREKSDVGTYLLENGYEITGGDNIVNVILVEFRALDTLGELAVLGMAGIALAAVLSTIRNRFMDPDPDRLALEEDDGADRPEGPDLGSETARRAILSSWGNTSQLQLMLKFLLPILAVISAILFLRGHNEPGGGFIAALVGSGVVGLAYVSTSRDRQIGPPRAPVYLIGGGVALAVGTGLWNMAFTGTYMEPQHGYVLGQHLTTSMVFDAGVYLAVVGLILLAFNVLGTARTVHEGPGGEGTRERVDETVLGEVKGPQDNPIDTLLSAGQRKGTDDDASAEPVKPTTRHISTGTRPDEWGR